ncbi:MAG: efflux RND transporter periplasmic adaptor subunit [Bacteroidales bacterium]|nr:efflux RND transporter periplasmic adaptor subunit [Bacteroidales bacterium]
MKKYSSTILAIIIVVVLAFCSYAIFIMSKPVAMEVQGEIDATQIKVGSKIPGRIDSLLVKKGQRVSSNTLLFTINSPEIEAKLQQAQAAREAAMAQNNKAKKGAQNEDIQAAYNTWQKAKAAADFAKKTHERIMNLYNDGVVPAQKKDEAETKMIAAVETEKAAKAIYEKAKNGARVEDKQAALAMVKRADGVYSEVSSYVNETRIFAPINGEVANIIAESGELIPSGYPVVTIVDLDDVWATFQLREDLLADIKKGSEIEASIPALGMKTVKFKVTYIHAMGDFATWTATKTSGDFDMKTFEVHAVPAEPVEGLLPGMSVLVNWSELKNKA